MDAPVLKYGRIPEYSIWHGIKQRTNNPKDRAYSQYGGRGIDLCKRWLDFAVFLEDVGPRPTPKHSLERKNNNKGYNPDNCTWASKKEQARNRKNTIRIRYKGEIMNLIDVCEMLGFFTMWPKKDIARVRV